MSIVVRYSLVIYTLGIGLGTYIHGIGKYRYRQNELLRYRTIGSIGIGPIGSIGIGL